MKKILLIDQDQKFIGDLQSKFAHRFEILATEDYETAYKLCRTVEIELLLIRLPPADNLREHHELKILLKKLKRRNFSIIIKVLTVSKEKDYQIEDYLKLGIAAVVVNVVEVEKWLK